MRQLYESKVYSHYAVVAQRWKLIANNSKLLPEGSMMMVAYEVELDDLQLVIPRSKLHEISPRYVTLKDDVKKWCDETLTEWRHKCILLPLWATIELNGERETRNSGSLFVSVMEFKDEASMMLFKLTWI